MSNDTEMNACLYAMLIDAGKAFARRDLNRLDELREEARDREDVEAFNQIDELFINLNSYLNFEDGEGD